MFASIDPGGEWLAPTLAAAGKAPDSRDECLSQLHAALDPGAPTSAERGRERLRGVLMSPDPLSLGRLGRVRLNAALHDGDGPESDTLRAEDILAMVRETAMTQVGRRETDVVDHLWGGPPGLGGRGGAFRPRSMLR